MAKFIFLRLHFTAYMGVIKRYTHLIVHRRGEMFLHIDIHMHVSDLGARVSGLQGLGIRAEQMEA